jgi:hypothetical protein
LPAGIGADLDLYQIVTAFRPGSGPQRIAQRLAAAATVVRGETHLPGDAVRAVYEANVAVETPPAKPSNESR